MLYIYYFLQSIYFYEFLFQSLILLMKCKSCTFFKIYFCIYIFFIFWLCWVFVSVRGLSLVVASRGHSSSRCAGLSLWWPLLLRSTGSRRAGSVVVVHGPSCSACGIFPDQGSNPCPLHWQADSQPLRHQGSPANPVLLTSFNFTYFRGSSQVIHCIGKDKLITIILFSNWAKDM